MLLHMLSCCYLGSELPLHVCMVQGMHKGDITQGLHRAGKHLSVHTFEAGGGEGLWTRVKQGGRGNKCPTPFWKSCFVMHMHADQAFTYSTDVVRTSLPWRKPIVQLHDGMGDRPELCCGADACSLNPYQCGGWHEHDRARQ